MWKGIQLYVQSEDIIEEQTDLQGLMMVSIHGPNDSEFDFRTAMNIWGKLRKRHILVEKAKESTENQNFWKKLWWNLFCKGNLQEKEELRGDMLKKKKNCCSK
jgi:hypothetical protein